MGPGVTIIQQDQIAELPKNEALDNLNQWIFDRIQSFVLGKTLELSNKEEKIEQTCLQNNLSIDIASLSLSNPSLESHHSSLFNNFDTVIALNIPDHQINYPSTMLNCANLVKKGGHLIVVLPVHTALYNGLDQGIEDWKILNRMFVNKLLRKYFKILKLRYFILLNSVPNDPIPGRIDPILDGTQYEERIAIFNRSKNILIDRIGLNLIVIGKKR